MLRLQLAASRPRACCRLWTGSPSSSTPPSNGLGGHRPCVAVPRRQRETASFIYIGLASLALGTHQGPLATNRLAGGYFCSPPRDCQCCAVYPQSLVFSMAVTSHQTSSNPNPPPLSDEQNKRRTPKSVLTDVLSQCPTSSQRSCFLFVRIFPSRHPSASTGLAWRTSAGV